MVYDLLRINSSSMSDLSLMINLLRKIWAFLIFQSVFNMHFHFSLLTNLYLLLHDNPNKQL